MKKPAAQQKGAAFAAGPATKKSAAKGPIAVKKPAAAAVGNRSMTKLPVKLEMDLRRYVEELAASRWIF